MRIGHGYDVHKFKAGRQLVLCGIVIPFESGLVGNSDADAPVHALMDAMLGAAALGDIGMWFPSSDTHYRDISSLILLERVRDMVAEKGYTLVNADITIVAQRPRISHYREEMRTVLANTLGVDRDCISIKATTEEGLGFTGSMEGLAAHAVVLLEKK